MSFSSQAFNRFLSHVTELNAKALAANPFLQPSIQTPRYIARGVNLMLAPYTLSTQAVSGVADVTATAWARYQSNVARLTKSLSVLPRLGNRPAKT